MNRIVTIHMSAYGEAALIAGKEIPSKTALAEMGFKEDANTIVQFLDQRIPHGTFNEVMRLLKERHPRFFKEK